MKATCVRCKTHRIHFKNWFFLGFLAILFESKSKNDVQSVENYPGIQVRPRLKVAAGYIPSVDNVLNSFCSGGAENLFDNIKSRKLELDPSKIRKKSHLNRSVDSLDSKTICVLSSISHRSLGVIKDLLVWIKENILRERPELFLQDDTV